VDGSRRIGGAPLLAAICVIAVLAVFNCIGDPGPMEENSKIAPSYLTKAPPAPPQEKRPDIDLTQPLQTGSYAIVCSHDLLIAAIASRAIRGPLDKIYDAFYSVLNRSSKVKAAGCQEWRAGIRVHNANQMSSPFDDFIGFGVTADGISEYFTMKSQLENTRLPSPIATPPSTQRGGGRIDLETVSTGTEAHFSSAAGTSMAPSADVPEPQLAESPVRP
jgi:hypothetical protein